MGIGRFFGLSSSSGSSSSSQPQAGYRPPLGPGSSKADYAQDLKSSGSPVSQWPAQGYHHGEDAPPAYFPQDRPERNDWTTDFKAPLPPKVHTDVALYPAPSEIHSPGGSGGEDPLLALRNHDIVLVMDDSYSMTLVDNPGGRSRWDQGWDAVENLARAGFRYDKDGIEIRFLNNVDRSTVIRNMDQLRRLRSSIQIPRTATHTPTGDVLDTLLVEYRRKLTLGSAGIKKKIIIVITDGAATDAPEDGIINAAKFLAKNGFPSDQVGIQFVQVGNDPEAAEFLDALDRDLPKQMGEYGRDIVDTIKSNGRDLAGDALVKALTGGFNRKQDRKGER